MWPQSQLHSDFIRLWPFSDTNESELDGILNVPDLSIN